MTTASSPPPTTTLPPAGASVAGTNAGPWTPVTVRYSVRRYPSGDYAAYASVNGAWFAYDIDGATIAAGTATSLASARRAADAVLGGRVLA